MNKNHTHTDTHIQTHTRIYFTIHVFEAFLGTHVPYGTFKLFLRNTMAQLNLIINVI